MHLPFFSASEMFSLRLRRLALIGALLVPAFSSARVQIDLLQPLAGDSASSALGVSGDGSMPVGFSWDGASPATRKAAAWPQGGAPILLHVPQSQMSWAAYASQDGSLVAGGARLLDGEDHVIVWTASGPSDLGVGAVRGMTPDGAALAIQSGEGGYLISGGEARPLDPAHPGKPLLVEGLSPDGAYAYGSCLVWREDLPDSPGGASRGARLVWTAAKWRPDGSLLHLGKSSAEFNEARQTWTLEQTSLATGSGGAHLVLSQKDVSQGEVLTLSTLTLATEKGAIVQRADLLKGERMGGPFLLDGAGAVGVCHYPAIRWGDPGAMFFSPRGAWTMDLGQLARWLEAPASPSLVWRESTIAAASASGGVWVGESRRETAPQRLGFRMTLVVESRPDSFVTQPGIPISPSSGGVFANDSEPPGSTAILDSLPSHGTVTLKPNGLFTYQPQAGFHGVDSFSYHFTSPFGQSSSSQVSLSVGEISGVSVDPGAVVAGLASQPATGRVDLGFVPVTPVTLTLSSDPPGLLSHPSSLEIAPGSATASFTIHHSAVPHRTAAKIKARLNGKWFEAPLVLQAAGVESLTLTPPVFKGRESVVGLVTLIAPSPSGGTVVALKSSDPNQVDVPPTVTVPAGQTSATFPVKPYLGPAQRILTLSASARGYTQSATLKIYTPSHSGLILPSLVVRGGLPIEGKAQLNGPTSEPVTITINAGPSSVLRGPSSLTIPAKASEAPIAFETNPVAAPASAVITSVLGKGTIRRYQIKLMPPGLTAVTSSATSTTGGTTLTITVEIEAPAPSPGLTIPITRAGPTVQSPNSVTIEPGQTRATFLATTSRVTSTQTAAVKAVWLGVTKSVVLTIRP